MIELTTELLVRMLLFILTFVVVYEGIYKFMKDRMISAIIAISASLLAVFYISYSQLDILNKSYGIFGIILLSLIPFMVAFFFIYNAKIISIFRKIFWIFYGITIILILQNNNSISSETSTLLTVIFVLIIGCILLLDKTIKDKLTIAKNTRMTS